MVMRCDVRVHSTALTAMTTGEGGWCLYLFRSLFLFSVLILTTQVPVLASLAINMAANKSPPRSFYRRALPETSVALNSEKGRAFFESSMANKGLKSFFPLIEQFTTQSEPAYCGISTLVVILNALSVDPGKIWKGPWRWYEESMLNCCISLEQVKTTGITLNTFVCLGRCQGLHVEPFLASEVSLDEFRDAVERACVESGCDRDSCPQRAFMVVSYTRKVLKQTGDGHFSPIAAYDKASDQVLILDTARFKYGPHWVSLELLYKAMQPVDSATKKSRGFVLLSFWGNETNEPQTPPQSVLFKAKKIQNPVRREYKEYLSNRQRAQEEPVTWEEARSFWTRDGKDPSLVWQAVHPLAENGSDDSQLDPVAKDLLKLIKQLMSQSLQSLPGQNDPEVTRSSRCQAHTIDAIFIIFLASLPAGDRRNIVYSDAVTGSDETRQQLLAEAELLVYALDASVNQDEISSCPSCQSTTT